MKIERATESDVYDVALRMRERDYAEFSAVSFANCRDTLAYDLSSRYGGRADVMCGFHENEPVCIGGTIEARPNVITLLFFATDSFTRVGFGATRFIRNELFPRVQKAGVHRIEAVSMVGNDDAHRWLKVLGLDPETGPLRRYGRGGEDFIQFSWVAP